MKLALLTALNFQPALHVRMGLSIETIIQENQYAFNLVLIALNFMKVHKLVECTVLKHLEAEV